jgi:hypothetical protein
MNVISYFIEGTFETKSLGNRLLSQKYQISNANWLQRSFPYSMGSEK